MNVLNKMFLRYNKQPDDARQRIFDWFLRPLLLSLYKEGKQENWDLLLEFIFNTDTRKTMLARAKRNFKMPGLYVKTPSRPIPGYGPRLIEKGAALFVGVDQKTGVACIQLGGIKEEWFFKLTRPEFASISDKLEILK